MVRYIFNILFLILLPLNLLAQDALLEVSPETGSLDDIFQLKIVASGASDDHPTLKGGDDFEIRFVGPQHSINIINGSFSQQTIFVYSLSPKKAGILKTPSALIKINGSFITLPEKTVKVEKRSGVASSDLVKLERWLNTTQAYLGEQLVSTLTFYQRVNINDSQLREGDYDGFWLEHIGTKKRFAAKLAGHQAEATGFTRVLFPLRTGVLNIQSSAISGKMVLSRKRRSLNPFGFNLGTDPFDQIFGRAEVKQFTVRSKEIQIKVKALPTAPKNIPNLDKINPLVGKTQVQAHYDIEPVDFGKGKTITYKVKSYGNLNPLQELPIENSNQYKIYRDNPYTDNKVKAGKVEFTKHFPITIIPLRGGLVKIPPVKLSYFDPDEEKYETAISREVELSVLGGFQAKIEEEDLEPLDATTTSSEGEKLKWQEESFLSKLLKTSHPLKALFIVLCVLFLILASVLFLRVLRLNSKRKLISKDIEKVTSIDEFETIYKKSMKSLFNLDKDFTRDDLKVSVKSSKLPVETSAAIVLIFDQVISRKKIDVNSMQSLESLKNDAIKTLSTIPL